MGSFFWIICKELQPAWSKPRWTNSDQRHLRCSMLCWRCVNTKGYALPNLPGGHPKTSTHSGKYRKCPVQIVSPPNSLSRYSARSKQLPNPGAECGPPIKGIRHNKQQKSTHKKPCAEKADPQTGLQQWFWVHCEGRQNIVLEAKKTPGGLGGESACLASSRVSIRAKYPVDLPCLPDTSNPRPQV